MNEKTIERKLREEVRQKGGVAIKFFAPSFTGLPDRIVLMPGGRIWFVEVKTTGKGLRPRQYQVIGLLSDLGFKVDVIDNEISLKNFLEKL